MATTPVEVLRTRADRIVAAGGASKRWTTTETESVPGGGTLPGVEIPSIGLRTSGDQAERLRSLDLPVIARVVDGHTICALRPVPAELDEDLASAPSSP